MRWRARTCTSRTIRQQPSAGGWSTHHTRPHRHPDPPPVPTMRRPLRCGPLLGKIVEVRHGRQIRVQNLSRHARAQLSRLACFRSSKGWLCLHKEPHVYKRADIGFWILWIGSDSLGQILPFALLEVVKDPCADTLWSLSSSASV